MGKIVNKNPISEKIDELIQELLWYKSYMQQEKDLPFGQVEFVNRNKDIINDARLLQEEITSFKKCSQTNDFKYSELEMKWKIIYSIMLLRYFNLA